MCVSTHSCARGCSWMQITHTPTIPHHYTDPLAIIPLYSSVFNDAWRLAFCLLGHPVLLEICLFWMRGFERGNCSTEIERWDTGGKESFNSNTGALPFIVEAILVLDRRFLIG